MCITKLGEENNNFIGILKEEVVFPVETVVTYTGTVQIEMTYIITKIDSAMDVETGFMG